MKALRTLVASAVLAGGVSAMVCQIVTAVQADSAALAAAGGGTLTRTLLDHGKKGLPIFQVNINYSNVRYEVYVNGCTGAVMKVIKG